MPNFTNIFDTSKPVGSDLANTLDTIIERDTKKSLAERYALEHIALDSAETGAYDKSNANAQGRHIAGAVSVLLTGTEAEISTFVSTMVAAGTPPGTGALAYATDTQAIKRFNGTSFVNLGLTAQIYTAGDGLTLTDAEFAVDFASEDDIITGTSTTKVPAVVDLQWAYGLTQYLEAKQIQAQNVAESQQAAPEYEKEWNEVIVNTIDGASIVSDYQIILPAGVYLIRCVQPMYQSYSGVHMKMWLYDETNTQIAVDSAGNQIISANIYGSADDSSTHMTMFEATISISDDTTFTVRSNGYKGTAANISGLYEQYGTLQIWKKKLEGV